MMRRRIAGGLWTVLGWLVVPAVLAAVLLARDRTTLERGNRLFRDGRAAEAVDAYRSFLGPDSSTVPTDDVVAPDAGPSTADPAPSTLVGLYNLGTALQRTGNGEDPGSGSGVPVAGGSEADTEPAAAVEYLERTIALGETLEGGAGRDLRVATTLQRAHYNLGAHYLGRLEPSMRLDSAFFVASAAVTHNREALFQDPEDDDARWNLALAQRSLDSLLIQMAIVDDRDAEEVEALEGIEFDEGMLTRAESSEPDATPPPEGTRPDPEERQADDRGEAQADIDGAREALEGRDPGLIDRARALETLRGFRDNPEMVVRGILWVQRPDVVWWDQTPYPGGDW